MADKSVNRRPAKADISRVINRGGSDTVKPEEGRERIFNLRVPEEIVVQVDERRKQRVGKVSRNTWILEAIEDRLEREGNDATRQ